MKNAAIIILICIALVLAWLLLYQGKDHDTHQSDYKEVVQLRDSFNRYEAGVVKNIEERNQTIRRQDSIIKDLMAERDAVRKDLDKSTNQAYRLTQELKAYKSAKDTSEYGRKFDSLLAEVENLTYLYTSYKQYSDSLTVVTGQQRQQLDSVINARAALYAELRRNYEQVNTKYVSLFNDYKDARKDIKRERLKTKVAAVLAIVAGGLMILK